MCTDPVRIASPASPRHVSGGSAETIFKSVTIAKLLDASSAWSGFTKATNQQRVKGFLRRSIRCGYCLPDFPTFADQCATADEKLFDKICLDNNHVPAIQHLLFLTVSVDTWHDKSCVLLLLLLLLLYSCSVRLRVFEISSRPEILTAVGLLNFS